MINVNNLDYNKIAEIFEESKLIHTNKDNFFYNIVTSFDIETTSAIVQGEKVAFMYIWQFAFEGIVVYGRTWQEFRDFCAELSRLGNLNKNTVLVCYIHNMTFEFQFMRKYFKWLDVFAVDDRKAIKVTNTYGIQFKDSYILSGYSLATVAKNLQKHDVKKLVGYLDYDKIRTKDTVLTHKELEYCAYDVIIVVDYIHEQIDQYGDITKIPLTNTGRVRKLVRNNVYYTSTNHRKSSGGKYRKYRQLMSELTLNKETYFRLKKAFQGGYTHANANKVGQTLHHVGSYDFTSSYPTVMVSEKFPMSRPFNVTVKNKSDFNFYRKHYNLLFDVKFTGLQSKIDFDNYLSLSKCHTINAVINNGRVYSADSLTTTITEIDLSIIEHCYTWESMAVSHIQAFYKQYLPKDIIKSIITLYQNKTKLKNVDSKKVEYMRSKGMLNSMYGMCVTDIIQQEHEYNNELSEWQCEEPDFDKQVEKYNVSRSRFLYYPWGIWVTAYARRNLWTGIIACGNDYCYSDTDSIKTENPEKHIPYIKKYNENVHRKIAKMCDYYGLDPTNFKPKTIKNVEKPIGVWDYEGIYYRFKTLGAKRYLTEQNGDLHLTLAGLSKLNGINYMKKQCGNDFTKVFDSFNDNLYIPAAETGKNTHTYIDDDMEFMITDCQGHRTHVKSKSGIHLSQADFTLSISREYGKFLNDLRNGQLFIGVDKIL